MSKMIRFIMIIMALTQVFARLSQNESCPGCGSKKSNSDTSSDSGSSESSSSDSSSDTDKKDKVKSKDEKKSKSTKDSNGKSTDDGTDDDDNDDDDSSSKRHPCYGIVDQDTAVKIFDELYFSETALKSRSNNPAQWYKKTVEIWAKKIGATPDQKDPPKENIKWKKNSSSGVQVQDWLFANNPTHDAKNSIVITVSDDVFKASVDSDNIKEYESDKGSKFPSLDEIPDDVKAVWANSFGEKAIDSSTSKDTPSYRGLRKYQPLQVIMGVELTDDVIKEYNEYLKKNNVKGYDTNPPEQALDSTFCTAMDWARDQPMEPSSDKVTKVLVWKRLNTTGIKEAYVMTGDKFKTYYSKVSEDEAKKIIEKKKKQIEENSSSSDSSSNSDSSDKKSNKDASSEAESYSFIEEAGVETAGYYYNSRFKSESESNTKSPKFYNSNSIPTPITNNAYGPGPSQTVTQTQTVVNQFNGLKSPNVGGPVNPLNTNYNGQVPSNPNQNQHQTQSQQQQVPQPQPQIPQKVYHNRRNPHLSFFEKLRRQVLLITFHDFLRLSVVGIIILFILLTTMVGPEKRDKIVQDYSKIFNRVVDECRSKPFGPSRSRVSNNNLNGNILSNSMSNNSSGIETYSNSFNIDSRYGNYGDNDDLSYLNGPGPQITIDNSYDVNGNNSNSNSNSSSGSSYWSLPFPRKRTGSNNEVGIDSDIDQDSLLI